MGLVPMSPYTTPTDPRASGQNRAPGPLAPGVEDCWLRSEGADEDAGNEGSPVIDFHNLQRLGDHPRATMGGRSTPLAAAQQSLSDHIGVRPSFYSVAAE